MSFTADIYKEICTDIAKNSRPNSVYAMRMLKLSNGINIAFSISCFRRTVVYVCVARRRAHEIQAAEKPI